MKNQIVASLAVALLLSTSMASFAQEAEAEASEAAEAESSAADANDGRTLSQIEPAEGFSNDTIDDAKIDSFIQAVSMVGQVGAHYTKLMQEEPDEDKRNFLVETANKDIVKAISAAPNITPEEFVAIDQASQADDVLNKRILARIEEIRSENKPKERLQFSEPEPEPAE
ncbi:DUF4168 domain-containing protein [Roseovarius phycicola]|uniref:DUF4168 domain-containing protein n=1 Tax=Roseovarius phycicola TaxID=3080976 RepID=A0ABZ2HF68_9RHOB